MDGLYKLTIGELSDLLSKREIKSVDILNSYIQRIKEKDPQISAYLYNDFEEAVRNA